MEIKEAPVERVALNGQFRYVYVPYIQVNADGTESTHGAHMNFRAKVGLIDKRRVKREVRKWIKQQLGRTVHSRDLALVMSTCFVTRDPVN